MCTASVPRYGSSVAPWQIITRNSARLTDQRGSHAFSCSPFTIQIRHFLPAPLIRSRPWRYINLLTYLLTDLHVLPTLNACLTSNRNNDLYNCMLYRPQWTVNSRMSRCESCEYMQLSCLTLLRQGTPVITSPESRVCGLHFCRWQYMHRSANFPKRGKPMTCRSQDWRLRKMALRGHPFPGQWKATKGLHIAI